MASCREVRPCFVLGGDAPDHYSPRRAALVLACAKFHRDRARRPVVAEFLDYAGDEVLSMPFGKFPSVAHRDLESDRHARVKCERHSWKPANGSGSPRTLLAASSLPPA
jgi:hypothetical protein